MARMRLDLEEWSALYDAAVTIPEDARRPCLKTAILGLEQIFSLAHGSERVGSRRGVIVAPRTHDCDTEECDKAYVSAIHRLDDDEDPFVVDIADVEEESVVEDAGAIMDRLDVLEQNLVEKIERIERPRRRIGE